MQLCGKCPPAQRIYCQQRCNIRTPRHMSISAYENVYHLNPALTLKSLDRLLLLFHLCPFYKFILCN